MSSHESLDPLPDPERVGGGTWLCSTGGRLTRADKRRMLRVSLSTQRQLFAQRLGRRRPSTVDLSSLLPFPDSRLVRDAEEAAATQSPELLAHGYRSAIFARLLALLDGVEVDHELLIVCGLLHDVGLVPSVVGEDFTVRSAAIARGVVSNAGLPDVASAHVADAIHVHTTIGIEVDRDGALGAYTQFGAMVDLVGLRERQLPYEFVAQVVATHPRQGFTHKIIEGLRSEARAVPGGRFDFLRRIGFISAVRLSAVPSRP